MDATDLIAVAAVGLILAGVETYRICRWIGADLDSWRDVS